MKKAIVLLIAFIFILTACAQSSTEPPFDEAEPQSSQVQHTPTTEELQSLSGAPQEANEDGVHVDLTQMNSTMVYSQVFDMITNPQNYEGKTIRMEGYYYTEQNPTTDVVYHLIVISDALGCCPQGIEFITSGDAQYPEVEAEYPNSTETVQVTGVYETYEEDGLLYFRLVSDEVEIV